MLLTFSTYVADCPVTDGKSVALRWPLCCDADHKGAFIPCDGDHRKWAETPTILRLAQILLAYRGIARV